MAAPTTFDANRILSTPLHKYLTSGEIYTREELLAAGLTEEQVGNKFLIDIPDDAGVVHYPKFQFDHNDDGQPTGLNEKVMVVNELMMADRDPLGVGDWWTGEHAYLPAGNRYERPLDYLGIWPKESYVSFLQGTALSDDD
jgi:hypothetical protein